MKKLIHCTRIGVDCVANDPVDDRCDEPEYFGFDFNVKKEQTEEMKKFIFEKLNSFDVPVAAIYSCGEIDLGKENVWTKERIVEAIREEVDDLKSEVSQNYGRIR